ncbi:2-succinyl-5-enolpyruvyl-6-hydroxy-3-cyclohexene-1-carboxylate synthase, partial [Actinotalea ferrariae CF5-4]
DAGRDPAAPPLELHVRIDERDAGFLALGMARGAALGGDARPVAVVTTSGTAVANLHPAVLEAHHAGVPLLLLTADRPHELRGTGANQTTEQVGLLEPVRLTVDVPAPTGRPGEDRDLRHLAARVVATALGRRTDDPGPVHVNLAYREPLVPAGEPWPRPARDGLTEVLRRGATAGGPPSVDAPAVAPLVASGAPARGVHDGVPTVVVAGDGAGPVARRVAEANGWPLLAEPSSGARGGPNAVPGYRLLLAEEGLGGAVRRVVVLGRPTLSRPVQALLGRADVESLVVAPTGADWVDAPRAATQVATEVPPALLAGTGSAGRAEEAWLAR